GPSWTVAPGAAHLAGARWLRRRVARGGRRGGRGCRQRGAGVPAAGTTDLGTARLGLWSGLDSALRRHRGRWVARLAAGRMGRAAMGLRGATGAQRAVDAVVLR